MIAKKGTKRVSKNIAGSGKLNTTVLACGSADGAKMPPFIIFSGTYVWSTWIPQNDYPGTAYTAQKKGWMEGTLFANWFAEVFLKNIPPKGQRNKKVILFFDGVAFHINYQIIKMAFENDVILVKLPPNLTHFMQPLDLTVFKPLKTAWNHLMIQWNRTNPGIPLPREDFSKKIKVLWEEHFPPRHLVSGFLHTGLFPADPSKFPEVAYNPIKLHRFKALEATKQGLGTSPSGTVTSTLTSTPPSVTPRPSPHDSHASSQISLPSSVTPKTSRIQLSYDSSNPDSPEALNLNPTETDVLAAPLNLDKPSMPGCSFWQENTQSPTSFENYIRFKLTESVSKNSAKLGLTKRKKISENKGEILTSKKVMERIKQAEEKKVKKQRKLRGESLGSQRKN